MKISRRGSKADYGEYNIEFENPEFEWKKSDSQLIIKQLNVKDFSSMSKSKHDYKICVTISEIN